MTNLPNRGRDWWDCGTTLSSEIPVSAHQQFIKRFAEMLFRAYGGLMETKALVPAAQYLRVSTERQEYSLDFQSVRIANYAQENGFEVCQTYCDEAKSGLEIRRRRGLSQLLRDVVGAYQSYKAVLVYDVSRWGRFQDPDEAAHYEFLCKAAGVQVHYCAEHFSNDGNL